MGCTLEELGERMSSDEFALWREDWMMEPWGERRSDLQAALISQCVANFAGKSVKHPLELSSFMFDFQRKQETEEDPVDFIKKLEK